MKISILTGTEDIASTNIRNFLTANFPFRSSGRKWRNHEVYILEPENAEGWQRAYMPPDKIEVELLTTDEKLIFTAEKDDNGDSFDSDFVIFASRHRSASGLPAILTHTPGNWTDNTEHGGSPRKLAYTSAVLLKTAYLALLHEKENAGFDWPVDLEVDHHGPTDIGVPIIFMELGSSKEGWNNTKGIKTVSRAIMRTVKEFSERKLNGEKSDGIIAIGFGGPHYARNFSKLYVNRYNVAFSHICPKYHIKDLDISSIKEMLEKTYEKVDVAAVDWKGTNSAEKAKIRELSAESGLEIIKLKDFKNIAREI